MPSRKPWFDTVLSSTAASGRGRQKIICFVQGSVTFARLYPRTLLSVPSAGPPNASMGNAPGQEQVGP
jgi:hypothetical protein